MKKKLRQLPTIIGIRMSCKKSNDLVKIYKQFLTCDKSISSDMNAAPPILYTNSAEVANSSNSVTS